MSDEKEGERAITLLFFINTSEMSKTNRKKTNEQTKENKNCSNENKDSLYAASYDEETARKNTKKCKKESFQSL